jgi:hypothetical protein
VSTGEGLEHDDEQITISISMMAGLRSMALVEGIYHFYYGMSLGGLYGYNPEYVIISGWLEEILAQEIGVMNWVGFETKCTVGGLLA